MTILERLYVLRLRIVSLLLRNQTFQTDKERRRVLGIEARRGAGWVERTALLRPLRLLSANWILHHHRHAFPRTLPPRQSFDSAAWSLLLDAREEAKDLGEPWVDTDAILLAFARSASGQELAILTGLGATWPDLYKAAQKLRSHIPSDDDDESPSSNIEEDWTAASLLALEVSARRARARGTNISRADILAGVLHRQDTLAIGVLDVAGVEARHVIESIAR